MWRSAVVCPRCGTQNAQAPFSSGALYREAAPPYLVIMCGLVFEELRLAVASSFDAELIHPVSKRVWVNTQDLCRPLWTIHHATGMFKGGQNMISICLVQREKRL
jgi:hypothetical protein